MFVPVGGGGLLSGVAAAVKALRPAVRVIGVEPAGAASMGSSRAAGAPVTLASTASIADGLLTLRPGELTFAHAQAFVDDLLTVSEDADSRRGALAAPRAGLVVEPSGAAATAGGRWAGGRGPTARRWRWSSGRRRRADDFAALHDESCSGWGAGSRLRRARE